MLYFTMSQPEFVMTVKEFNAIWELIAKEKVGEKKDSTTVNT